MEADWSVEIGADSACIDGSWEGFIDLRRSPDAVESVMEAAEHLTLREALLALNNDKSPVFTTKCDTWSLAEGEIDADEFDARKKDTRAGFASYIDILERDLVRFASFEFHEQHAREITACLRTIDLRQGRVDIVARAAIRNRSEGYGLTLYTSGCGSTPENAVEAWQAVLQATVAATIAPAPQTLPKGE
jgi:hypothetical protein